VVDDDPDFVEALKEALAPHDYSVKIAHEVYD